MAYHNLACHMHPFLPSQSRQHEAYRENNASIDTNISPAKPFPGFSGDSAYQQCVQWRENKFSTGSDNESKML